MIEMFAWRSALLLLIGIINNSRCQPNSWFQYYFSHLNEESGFFAPYADDDDSSMSLFNNEDEEINHKISGGSYASHGQFPFMVVVHRLAGAGRYFVCGGSILSERWVLTAGHCIASRPRRFFVVFGIVDKASLKYDSSSGDGISMITTQGALHPKYRRGLFDIGVLYMPKKIPFSDTISPIRIADHAYKTYSFSNTMGNIYGWGKEYRSGGAIQRLKFGKAMIISNQQCKMTWSGVDDTRICTISMGDDVCQGDSGGPLVVYDEDDEPLQIGIVSYGDADCPSSRPAVFTRVSTFAHWIASVTDIDYD